MNVDDDPSSRRKGRVPDVDDDDGDGGEEEGIEILDVTATDEAGVSLPDSEVEQELLIEEPPPRGAAATADLDARLEAAEARAAELKEQLVRTAADFENFRKRVERDREEERRHAAQALVKSLLPALDNFARALHQGEQAARESPAVASFVEGVSLIQGQLFDILRAAGLEPVDASGIFDPNVHEALMQEPTTDRPHMAVTEVFEPGYKLHGRLLRPARVKVAWNPGGSGVGADADSRGEAAH